MRHNPLLAKMGIQMLGYDYEIKYKHDKENNIEDALSRIDNNLSLMLFLHQKLICGILSKQM